MAPHLKLYLCLSTLLLTKFIATQSTSNGCYCLHKEVDGLKGAIHVEVVNMDGEQVYLVAEQLGVIYTYNPYKYDGTKLTPYINVSHLILVDPQQPQEIDGLMGFAAHPDFVANKKLYLYTVREINGKHYVVVSEITGTDVTAEKVMLVIEHRVNVAKGGQLLFGLDGYLYVFLSDAVQSGNVTHSEAQNGEDLLGKVLRLDVNKLTVADFKLQYYDIPPNNPRKPTWRPEVYATGLCHPWRCSIDKGDSKGRIFCGDINDMTAEEVNIIQPGGNYGHPYKEGLTCMVNESLCNNIEDEVLPIYAFNRSTGQVSVVVGGPFYRGTEFTSIQEHLIIGDYGSGLLYTLEENSATSTWTLHNFTECSPEMCGCNYESPRLRFLASFGITFSGEPMLLMLDSLRPGDPTAALLSLYKPPDEVTCGAAQFTTCTVCIVVTVMITFLKVYESE